MTTNSPNTVDGDVLKELRNRYEEPKIPKCRICGGELSVQRAGGGGPTIWACSGMIDDPTGERNWIYAEGRSCADEHYERSRWTDYRSGGDSDVIDLINAYLALLDERLNATAQPVSDGCKVPEGWKLVPIEATEEMLIDGFESEPDEGFSEEAEWEKYQSMSGCEQAKHRARLCWNAMLAAAPGGQGD